MPIPRHLRSQSHRLRGWDYSQPGAYFVTICTANNQPSFGRVHEGVVVLSPIGKIVDEEWQRTQQLRQGVHLDDWVIMPNHLHGIIVIEAPSSPGHPLPTPRRGVATNDIRHWKSGSLGAIINQFKSTCTKRIRSSMSSEFAWQPRFYDHIIRNEHDLARIRRYIRNNPAQWSIDEYHIHGF